MMMISFQRIIDNIINSSIYFVLDNEVVIDSVSKNKNVLSNLNINLDERDLKLSIDFVMVNDIKVGNAKEFYFRGTNNVVFLNNKNMIPSFGNINIDNFVGALNYFVLNTIMKDHECDSYKFTFFDVDFFKYNIRDDYYTFFLPDTKSYNNKLFLLSKELDTLKSLTTGIFLNNEHFIDNVMDSTNNEHYVRNMRRMIFKSLIKIVESVRRFYDRSAKVDLILLYIMYNIFVKRMNLNVINLDADDDLGTKIDVNVKDIIKNLILNNQSLSNYTYINDSILSFNNIVSKYFYSIKTYGIEKGFSMFYVYVKRLFNMAYVVNTMKRAVNLSKYGIDIMPKVDWEYNFDTSIYDDINKKVVMFKERYGEVINFIKNLLPKKRLIERYYILRTYIYSIMKSYLNRYLIESGQSYQIVYIDDYNDLVRRYCLYTGTPLEKMNDFTSIVDKNIDESIFDFVEFLYYLPNLYYYKMMFEK